MRALKSPIRGLLRPNNGEIHPMSETVNGKYPAAGRLALVTGATRGIGRAIVEHLAQEGYRIVFCSRSADDSEAMATELCGQGHEVYGHVCDVRDPQQITDLVTFAMEKSDNRGIEVLVNNAGRPGGGPTKTIDDELWNDVIETNLTSVFRFSREVLNRGGMLERGRGAIINISSTGGKQGVPLGAPYSASKAGVIAFSKALGKELAKTGVTVNAVCPGFVETPMAEKVRENFARIWGSDTETVKTQFEGRIPTGRYVRPNEVATMVSFLAGTTATSITAQAMNVCGGLGSF